jgi:hypothetical protein
MKTRIETGLAKKRRPQRLHWRRTGPASIPAEKIALRSGSGLCFKHESWKIIAHALPGG